jgi:hypothetical protein
MEYFEITFRFNNENKSLTRFDGLSINILADFLKSLYDVSKGVADGELVLSEIKGNCYAAVCSSPNITTIEYIQTLHSHISSENFSSLKFKEREYSKKIMDILSDNLVLNVYNKDKTFYKTIQPTKKKYTSFPYYFETDLVKGVLTRIGGRNINTKNSILISTYSGEIEINEQQDNRLKNYYKNGLIDFYITKKINKDTLKVESTVLDDFMILEPENISFTKTLEKIRNNHGAYFSQIDLDL